MPGRDTARPKVPLAWRLRGSAGPAFGRIRASFGGRDRARGLRQFALSSGVFRRDKLAQAIRHAALAGYGGIEVVADVPHAYPPHLTEADRRAIRSALAQNRVTVSNVNARTMAALRADLRPSWIEPDRVLREERIRHTVDAGRLALELGSPTVSTLAGGELSPEMTRDAAVRHLVAGLRTVAAVAAKGKCPRVLIDPDKGLVVGTAGEALDVLSLVGSRHVGVNFNTGHFHRTGHDLAAAVRELKNAIGHVHVQDVARDGPDAVVTPGAGVVDFAAVFGALDSIGYKGWLTVELSGADVHPDEAARQALQFLRQFEA